MLQRLCLAVLDNNCQRGKASKTELILLKKNLWDRGPVSLYEAPTQQDLKAFQICKYWWTQWSPDVLIVEPQEYVYWSMLHSALYVSLRNTRKQITTAFSVHGQRCPQEVFYKGGQRGSWGRPPLFMGTANNDSEKRKTLGSRSAPNVNGVWCQVGPKCIRRQAESSMDDVKCGGNATNGQGNCTGAGKTESNGKGNSSYYCDH